MKIRILCSIFGNILHNNIDNVVSVKEKGLKTLIAKSTEKDDKKCELWFGQFEMNFQ